MELILNFFSDEEEFTKFGNIIKQINEKTWIDIIEFKETISDKDEMPLTNYNKSPKNSVKFFIQFGLLLLSTFLIFISSYDNTLRDDVTTNPDEIYNNSICKANRKLT